MAQSSVRSLRRELLLPKAFERGDPLMQSSGCVGLIQLRTCDTYPLTQDSEYLTFLEKAADELADCDQYFQALHNRLNIIETRTAPSPSYLKEEARRLADLEASRLSRLADEARRRQQELDAPFRLGALSGDIPEKFASRNWPNAEIERHPVVHIA